MAYAHVDPSGGTDSTGRGSVASPYKSVQYALTDNPNWADGAAAVGTNIVYVWNTAADVLTTTITVPTALNAENWNVVIAGYDGGGSLTLTDGQGQTQTCGEIDGNNAVANIMASEVNVYFVNMKCHSTTSYLWFTGSSCGWINCEVYHGATRTVWMNGVGWTYNTRFVADLYTVNQYNVTGVGGHHFQNCTMIGGYYGIEQPGSVIGCLVRDVRKRGIRTGDDNARIIGCTIDGIGADSDAIGIYGTTNAIWDQQIILDNLITNWDGATSKGIAELTNAPYKFIGNNGYYNNTTDVSVTSEPAYELGGADFTETSDPFTDSASGDFTLASGADSEDAATINPDPANPGNVGYDQDYASGGGGGGAENVTIW